MRTIVQRILEAAVEVDGQQVAGVGSGLLALVGIEKDDTQRQVEWTAHKLANLRIFEDDHGRMNLSTLDLLPEKDILIVPNFTVAGDARKGHRPSFDNAMRPEPAEPMFQQLVDHLLTMGIPTHTGIFRAHMHIRLINDGPVTIVLESAR